MHIKEKSMQGISLNNWVLKLSNDDQMLTSIFIYFPNLLISYKNIADKSMLVLSWWQARGWV